jgi:hypothetical protein
MTRLSFLLIFIPCFTFAQSKADKILTDSSMAVGIISEDCYGGKNVESYCMAGVDKSLTKGSIILIGGIQNCKRSYSNTTTQFYEILYNMETYFVEKDKVLTEESYYSQIEKMSSTMADSFRNHAQYVSKILYEGNRTKAFDFLIGCKSKGLAILQWSFYDESEYTEGTSAKIKVYNPTSKTIKYLWFTFVGYNAVDDKIIDRKRGTSNITVKAIGPIKPDESGTYDYTYVWFTDLVQTAVISNIKVQYMDGSFKTISNPKEIMLKKDLYNLIFEDE